MDMQHEMINNVSRLDADYIETVNVFTNDIQVNGVLTFSLGSWLNINGTMLDPSLLINSVPPTDVGIITDMENRLSKLEEKSITQGEVIDRLLTRIDYLEKITQL